MQLPLFAVLARPIVVIQPVGQVGIFLNLRYQRTGSDGVDGAGGNEKHIVFSNGYPLQILSQGAFGDGSAKGGRLRVPTQAVDQAAVFGCVQDVPHFRFPQLAVFVFPGVGIVRVHLDG